MSTPLDPRQSQPPYGYAPTPKKSHKWLWITLAILGLLLVGCVASIAGVSNSIDDAVDEAAESASASPAEPQPAPSEAPTVNTGLGSADASGDVVLGEAMRSEFGTVTVPVTVTNASAKRSDYFITIAANDPAGTRLDETMISVMGLDPGQAAQEDAMFLGDGFPDGTTFQVLEVQRTASV